MPLEAATALHRAHGVGVLDVADFMADDAQQLLVVHHVHQTCVHTDGAVGRRIGVHILAQVHLEVEIQAVFIDVLARQALQALGVFVVRRRQLFGAVSIGAVLQRHRLEFLVRDCHGLEHIHRRADLVFRLGPARTHCTRGVQGRSHGRQPAGRAPLGGHAAGERQRARQGDVRHFFHVDSLVEISTATGAATVVMAGRAHRGAVGCCCQNGAPLFHAPVPNDFPPQAIATVRIFRLWCATRRLL